MFLTQQLTSIQVHSMYRAPNNGMERDAPFSRAPHAEALSRLRRLNGARDGPLSGGRRRRPNHSMELTYSLSSDVAALAPCSSRRATGSPTPRGVQLISRPVGLTGMLRGMLAVSQQRWSDAEAEMDSP